MLKMVLEPLPSIKVFRFAMINRKDRVNEGLLGLHGRISDNSRMCPCCYSNHFYNCLYDSHFSNVVKNVRGVLNEFNNNG